MAVWMGLYLWTTALELIQARDHLAVLARAGRVDDLAWTRAREAEKGYLIAKAEYGANTVR